MPLDEIELINSVENKESKLDMEKSNIFWLKDSKRKMFEEDIYPTVYYARTMGANNLTHTPIRVNIQTTNILDSFDIMGLLDNSVTYCFINKGFVHHHQLTTRRLPRSIIVYNVDGTKNQSGSVKEELDLIMTFKGHKEKMTFSIMNISDKNIIIDHNWLKKHNPEID